MARRSTAARGAGRRWRSRRHAASVIHSLVAREVAWGVDPAGDRGEDLPPAPDGRTLQP